MANDKTTLNKAEMEDFVKKAKIQAASMPNGQNKTKLLQVAAWIEVELSQGTQSVTIRFS